MLLWYIPQSWFDLDEFLPDGRKQRLHPGVGSVATGWNGGKLLVKAALLLHPLFRTASIGTVDRIHRTGITGIASENFHRGSSRCRVQNIRIVPMEVPACASGKEPGPVKNFKAVLLQMTRHVIWKKAIQANEDPE